MTILLHPTHVTEHSARSLYGSVSACGPYNGRPPEGTKGSGSRVGKISPEWTAMAHPFFNHSQECDRADAPPSSGAVNLVSVPHSKGIS